LPPSLIYPLSLHDALPISHLSEREDRSMLRALRVLLVLDAVLLFLLGAAFLVAPRQVASVFQFGNLPDGVYYVLAMWGCALASRSEEHTSELQSLRHLVCR